MSTRRLLARGCRIARSLRQCKSEWKMRLGNTRRNGGRQGRLVDNRALKRAQRAGRK